MSCSWGSTSWPHPSPPRGPTSQVVTLRVRCQHRHPGVGWGDKDIRSAAPHRQQTFTGGRGSVTEWVMVSQQSKVQPWRRGKRSFGPHAPPPPACPCRPVGKLGRRVPGGTALPQRWPPPRPGPCGTQAAAASSRLGPPLGGEGVRKHPTPGGAQGGDKGDTPQKTPTLLVFGHAFYKFERKTAE